MRALFLLMVLFSTSYSYCATAQQNAEPVKIDPVVITATPLDKQLPEMAQPATVLKEDELRRKRAASIGVIVNETIMAAAADIFPALAL